jgi:hypothetical protein
MEPYPDQDDQPEPRTGSRGGLIVAVVVVAILLLLIVLHLTGGMALHRP